MAEDGEVSRTSLDSGVDKNINEPIIRSEKYKDGLAAEHNKSVGNLDKPRKSWTMAQIDRTVASSILPSKGAKLAQYGIGLNRKNDFRLQDLSGRLNRELTKDFDKEIKTGPITHRLRDFDIKSQTMRMITANATLGSYQFQKTQVLPYMRRNLSLGYQKVDLLKRVVGGISSLEKALVNKLEAIKMNTAAPETSKVSLFRQIKDEMRSQQVKKIASNLTDVVMQGYNKTYKKHVMPVTKRLHEIMSDPTKRGGVNGVVSEVTKKANALRRSLRDAQEDTSQSTGIDKVIGNVKNAGNRVASKILNVGVATGQKIVIPERVNSFIRNRSLGFTEFWSKANPFSKPSDDDDDDHTDTSRLGISPDRPTRDDRLLSLMTSWYKESTKDNNLIIENLKAIRYNTENCCAGPSNKRKNTIGKNNFRKANRQLPDYTAGNQNKLEHHLEETTPVSDPRKPIFGSIREKLSANDHTTKLKDVLHSAKEATTEHVAKASRTTRNAAAEKIKQAREERRKKAAERTTKQPTTRVTTSVPKVKKITSPKTTSTVVAKAAERVQQEKGKSLLAMGAGELGSHIGDKAVGLAGGVLKGGAKLGGRAAVGLLKGGGSLALKAASIAPGLAWGGTKLLAKGGWGATKLAAGALGTVGKFGGGMMYGAGKAALGGLGRGALGFAKSGVGMSLGAGLAGTGINYLSDKYLTGGTKRLGKTAGTAMQYGAMGATIGSIIPGIGTAIGGGIGAAVGALVANMDYVSKGVKFIGDGFAYSAKSLMDIGSSFTKSAGEALAAFKKKISDVASSVGNAVSTGAGAVGGAIASGASAVGSAVSSGASAIYSGVTSTIKMAGNQLGKAKDAVAYMIKKGWSKAAALGIVANLYQESGLNTQIVGDSGKAIGIAQWHGDRQRDIQQKFGKHPNQMNLNEQLDAVDWELRSGKQFKSTHLAALQKTSDPGQAAALISEFYERPANKEGEKIKRAGIANKLAGSVGDTTPKPSAATGNPSSSASSNAKDKLWANAKTTNSLRDPNIASSPASTNTPSSTGKLPTLGKGSDFGMGPKTTSTKTMGANTTTKPVVKPQVKVASKEDIKPEPKSTTPVVDNSHHEKSIAAITKLASAVEKHTATVSEHTNAVKDHSTKVAEATTKGGNSTTNNNKTIVSSPSHKPIPDNGAFITMSMKKVPVRTGLTG
jgi:hypothetical protein